MPIMWLSFGKLPSNVFNNVTNQEKGSLLKEECAIWLHLQQLTCTFKKAHTFQQVVLLELYTFHFSVDNVFDNVTDSEEGGAC